MLLLLIYSLVQLPSVSVSIADLASHSSDHDRHDDCAEDEAGGQVELPGEETTAVSFLRCMESFVAGDDGPCTVYVSEEEEDVPLPWCAMASETAHALWLATIFELALLGWVLNVLANPIIYAFWRVWHPSHMMLRPCCPHT